VIFSGVVQGPIPVPCAKVVPVPGKVGPVGCASKPDESKKIKEKIVKSFM
jgi:hypothetical protein